MQKKIRRALISVYNKNGLPGMLSVLHKLGVDIVSTGGTSAFIKEQGLSCTDVETLTSYPSILGGRVKTLHPAIFGGILSRSEMPDDLQDLDLHKIQEIDLVIVDLYPFQETLEKYKHDADKEPEIIEKIDIGGVALIRAAAKNFNDVCVISSIAQYQSFIEKLETGNGLTDSSYRRFLAAAAFEECTRYDTAISSYFNADNQTKISLRYGENPHQSAEYIGDLSLYFKQLHGKEISYNNLIDLNAAFVLMNDCLAMDRLKSVFAIIKHTNVCGMASRPILSEAWEAALAGDPESAFGGVIITNTEVDYNTAKHLNELFFEVLIAPSYHINALEILKSKKNRILLQQTGSLNSSIESKALFGGTLTQQSDVYHHEAMKQVGARETTSKENIDLEFANIIAKNLKSNAISIVKDVQLMGKGCGQTSRVDALKQALSKAHQNNLNIIGSSLASDAFFPFDDCVKLAHDAGVAAIIQPGGSIRDQDSINYCKENNMAMVLSGIRHFKH